MSTEVEILKVKLNKNNQPETIHSETHPDKAKSKITGEHDKPVHKDFVAKMDNLKVHFAMLTGYVPGKDIKDLANIKQPVQEIIDSFKVRGVSLSGEAEDQKFILSGHRILPNGKAQILNTPLTRFNDESENAHPYLEELTDAIKEVKDETIAYFGGKFAEDPQGDLFNGKDKDEEKK